MKKGMGKTSSKFTVSKEEQVGLGNSFKNSFTRGGLIGGMADASNNNFICCEQLVDITADEIEVLKL